MASPGEGESGVGRFAASIQEHDKVRLWQGIKDGISEVYAHKDGITCERYLQWYSLVYSYTSGNRPTGSSKSVPSSQSDNSNGNSKDKGYVDSTNTSGADLYRNIRELLKDHVTKLEKSANELTGEELLSFYLAQWEKFTFSSKVLNGFCAYLNRHWIRNNKHVGGDIVEIYQLTLNIWKRIFFGNQQSKVVTVMLSLISRDRNGETINISMIKGIVASMVELGADWNSVEDDGLPPINVLNRTEALGIYQKRFEDAFVAATDDFYATESSHFRLNIKSVSDYMKKVEVRISEEVKRVEDYLHKSSMDRLMKTCDDVLIRRQLSTFHDEFPVLLKEDAFDDMGRMYDLVSRLKDSFGDMMDILQDYIFNAGTAAISLNKDQCTTDPRVYIETILDVYNTFHKLVKISFKSDPGFCASLDKACELFINKNALTIESGSSYKSPEMLAKYCDVLLRKKNNDEHELDELLNKAIIIFKFIDGKDVFQKFYTRMLANRLIGQLSASDDAESSMIAKFKLICGYEYTTKLQRMFQDIVISRDMNEEFKGWQNNQEQAQSISLDFNIMVLISGSWPFTLDTNELTLPIQLVQCVKIFTPYYVEKHIGRKLHWLYSKSRGEVTANCFPLHKYVFTMSTYSMGILLQYNTNDSYRIQGLMDATQLPKDVVIQIVQIFMKANLLNSKDSEDKLSSESEVKLNKEYKNKRPKVNLLVPLKTEVKMEDDRTEASIVQERVHEVQAAIVRVMKTRKELEHQLLITEVVKILSRRFSPSIAKSIRSLIEKEYIAPKKEDDKNVYTYIS